MSEKPLRGRIPVNRRIKPPHPSSSTHRLHRKVVVIRRSSKKHSKFIKRWNSEPTLLTTGISIAGADVTEEHRYMTPPGDSCAMFLNRISTDVFSSSPELLPDSPEKRERYNRDAKVVVKVTVEGSPGPIRALVKLGSSVDETIRLVTNKYNSEGRSPQLDQDAITSFELHNSNFSLQCLDKSNMIGEIGCRSFYMRKSANDMRDSCSNTFIDSEIIACKANNSPSPSSNISFPSFIFQGLKKIIRTSKIWRLLGCFDG
ncbi:uncharacterized protein At4g22758 [Cynara cardunculus var. scolymus]|uniref:uncharacterized protein At4g22758 n=1 Tax=Cynara cardunculus var. scolymus TaxID=59895 RepID=UPI000D62AFEE|nr:uncharacterized protein At4g22758 [Cynara cardunculus var. scolymus]